MIQDAVDGWLSLGRTGLIGLDPACILSGASPEIGSDPTGCKDGLGGPLDTDQRGGDRCGTCDRGAFERGTAVPFFADDFETGGLWLWSTASD